MKEYRELIQFGTFYRLKSPFEGNETVWMTVSEDKKTSAGILVQGKKCSKRRFYQSAASWTGSGSYLQK